MIAEAIAGTASVGLLALLGSGALPRVDRPSPEPPDLVARVLAGLGVFGLLAVGTFAGRLSLTAFLALVGVAAALSAARLLATGRESLRHAAGSLRRIATEPPPGIALELLAVGSAVAGTLFIGVRYVGGDEMYHVGRIRALLESGPLSLIDPISGIPGGPSRPYLVPVFHLLGAALARVFRLTSREAYVALCLFAVLLVWIAARHLGRRIGERIGGAAFSAVMVLQLLWLPLVDVARHQYNYLFPFTPGEIAKTLIALLLTAATSAVAEKDYSEARWRPLTLGFIGAMLVHPSCLLIVLPWIAITVPILLVSGRLALPDLRALPVRLGTLVLLGLLFTIAVRVVGTGDFAPNDLDPVVTRDAPLHPFETERLQHVAFLSDRFYFIRPTGRALLGGGVTLALVLLHLARGGTAALAWIAAAPIFALLLCHNPIVFPYVARQLTFHFGILWSQDSTWLPGFALPLAAATLLRDPPTVFATRTMRRTVSLLTVCLIGVLAPFTLWQLRTQRRIGTGLQVLSRPALWNAVERTGDRNGYLLTDPEVAIAVPAFTSMKPYFCNRPPCRPFYADYFVRRRHAEALLGGSLDAAAAKRDGIWGELRRNRDYKNRPVPPRDGATVVYQDPDWTLVRF